MSDNSTTVFIIDDDASVRKGLSRLVRSAGHNAEVFDSAEAFLARERFHGIGCIILDVRMPGLSGIDLQKELTSLLYDIPVIFITGHGDIAMSVDAMKQGAIDFLPKPFDDGTFLAAIDRAVETSQRSAALRSERDALMKGFQTLSPREMEILRHVLSGKLNKQIAHALAIAEKTVKIHRARIMEKLSVRSLAELVRLAGKAGIEPQNKE